MFQLPVCSKLLKSLLMVCLCVLTWSIVSVQNAIVYADGDDCPSDPEGVRMSWGHDQADAYYYSDNSLGGSAEGGILGDCRTYNFIQASEQYVAIYDCGTACLEAGAPINSSTHGVAYCEVAWYISWDHVIYPTEGPVEQQYDCGDTF